MLRNWLGKMILGAIAMAIFAFIMLFFSWIVMTLFSLLLFVGIASLFFPAKKTVAISSRAIGHIEKDGKVIMDKILGYEVVEEQKYNTFEDLCTVVCGPGRQCSEDPYCPLHDPKSIYYKWDKKVKKK